MYQHFLHPIPGSRDRGGERSKEEQRLQASGAILCTIFKLAGQGLKISHEKWICNVLTAHAAGSDLL